MPLSPTTAAKRRTSWEMFDTISSRYDLTNRALSLGCDQAWRRSLLAHLPQKRAPIHLLDCATGTGDQILALLGRKVPFAQLVGIDPAEKMLEIAYKKLARFHPHHSVQLLRASMTAIPFPDGSFDCVTLSFGLRNVEEQMSALQEIHRVLQPAGRLLLLEFSLPEAPLLRWGCSFYLRHVVPRLGSLFAGDRAPYQYLADTIQAFPSGLAMCQLLEQAGFTQVRPYSKMLGAVTLYVAEK